MADAGKVPNITHQTVELLKSQDAKMASALRFIVPTFVGEQRDANGQMAYYYGPQAYPHAEEPPIWDKMNYSRLITGKNPHINVNITDKDVEVIKDKAAMAELWDFENWIGKTFQPHANPANKAFLTKIYPQYFTSKLQEMQNWVDFKKQVETLKIKGPSDLSDLFLQYRLGWPEVYRSQQGVNDKLVAYTSEGNMPMLYKRVGGNGEPTADDRRNFEEGLFGKHWRYLTWKQLIGGERSVFPKQQGLAGRTRDLRDVPFGDGGRRAAWNMAGTDAANYNQLRARLTAPHNDPLPYLPFSQANLTTIAPHGGPPVGGGAPAII